MNDNIITYSQRNYNNYIQINMNNLFHNLHQENAINKIAEIKEEIGERLLDNYNSYLNREFNGFTRFVPFKEY